MTGQNRSTAVMQRRAEPPDSLDYFPTPPWATRALLLDVPEVAHAERGGLVWEPACGGGHMAHVLAEFFPAVHASDVHDYGWGHALGSYVGEGADRTECPEPPDWIITNPPYALAEQFAHRALREARRGVAMLLRLAWTEGVERYQSVFSRTPPSVVAPFVERVAIVKGRWEPGAASATAYAWFIWRLSTGTDTRLQWIPPGRKRERTRPDDVARFAVAEALPLFGDAAE